MAPSKSGGPSGRQGGPRCTGRLDDSEEDEQQQQLPLYALAKWVTGIYADTYMHDLDVDWIRDFSRDDNFKDESYVVEWRVQPRPRHGWNLFDANIIEVSTDKAALKRLMLDLEGRPMPGISTTPATPCSSRIQAAKGTAAVPATPTLNVAPDQLKEILRSLLKTPSTDQALMVHEEEIKVGKVLSVSKSSYTDAKTTRSPSIMTMGLVRHAFSVKRLKRCTYAGQKRTVNGVINVKPGLKKYQKMRDIQTFVQERFPLFTQSQFCNAVNSCTGKNVEKKKKEQLLDVSSSEEEMSDVE